MKVQLKKLKLNSFKKRFYSSFSFHYENIIYKNCFKIERYYEINGKTQKRRNAGGYETSLRNNPLRCDAMEEKISEKVNPT